MAYPLYHLAGEICQQDPETCRHNLSEEFYSWPNMSESPRMNIHVTRSSQSAVRTEFFRQIVPASFRILPADFPGEMIQRVRHRDWPHAATHQVQRGTLLGSNTNEIASFCPKYIQNLYMSFLSYDFDWGYMPYKNSISKSDNFMVILFFLWKNRKTIQIDQKS